jgi:hypothetical protein
VENPTPTSCALYPFSSLGVNNEPKTIGIQTARNHPDHQSDGWLQFCDLADKHGADTLSNAELAAILIRTCVKGSGAVDLGRELLRRFKTLRQMSGADVAEFHGIKGSSTARIAHIKAAVLSTKLRKKDLMACLLHKVAESIPPKEKSMS